VSVTNREARLPEFDPIEPPRGLEAWIKIGIPVAGTLLGLGALFVSLAPDARQAVFSFLGVYMIPGGIDAGPVVGVTALGLHPLVVTGLILYFDLWFTLFWVWNLDHLARFDLIGNRVDKSRKRAHQLWKKFPRLRVASGPGLMLFIMIPIPTTGSFTGIAIGKLLELPDKVVYAASVAATTVRVFMLAIGAEGLFLLF
jgi:uncharacterized membrane protein